jgi:hypothetical protein
MFTELDTFIIVGCHTGLRLSELLNLELSDIDFVRRIQKLMGHRSITTTERYARVSRDNFASAIALLNGFVTDSVTRPGKMATVGAELAPQVIELIGAGGGGRTHMPSKGRGFLSPFLGRRSDRQTPRHR